MAPSMAPTVLERAIRPLSTVPVWRGREGRNQRQEQKQKGSHRLPFCLLGSEPFAQQRALTPAPAHPSAARNVGWHGWVRLAGTVSGMDAAAKPPRTGLRRVPGSLTHPGPAAERHPAGNALNLTAPRKCPPRPCRCRCTSSPCRTSAGDDAGRAAGSRYGSHRWHPAGGPGRSHHPAG